jgi:hypothetical protein
LAYARSQQWQVTGTELNPHLALRGKAQPLWGVGPVLTLYRLAVWPVRTLLNLWVRVFFLGGAPIDFSAANIVAVLRKRG